MGRFIRNTYTDTSALADGLLYDEWNYKAIYVISDEQVGLFSRVVPIDVKRM